MNYNLSKRERSLQTDQDKRAGTMSLTLAASWRHRQPNENPKKRLLN